MSAVKRRRGRGRIAAIKAATTLAIEEGTLESARAIQKRVVPLIPVNSGRLRDAFASPDAIEDGLFAARFGQVNEAMRKRTFYAGFIERGTSDGRIPPQPFFFPAVELARDEVRRIMTERLERGISEAQ